MGGSLFKSEKEELVKRSMSWSLYETQDALSESLFINIPNEIVLHIFQFLSVRDICNVSLVCRSFKMIADDDEIWKLKCNTSIKLYSKSYKQIYIDWIQGKALRNETLLKTERLYNYRTACVYYPPPSHPRRPIDKQKFECFGSFKQHPNSTQEMTINFSVDIDETVPELLILIEKASGFQKEWQQSAVLKQMIQRYYQFMQLKSSNPSNILLIPTLDIEIIWQTHLLRPEIYRNDCLRLFHRIIDHSLIIKNDMERFLKDQAFLDTCQLYEQRFGKKYCPLTTNEQKNKMGSYFCYYAYKSKYHNKPICSYWDKTHFEFSSNPPNDYENPFSFTEADIILDGKWFDLCKAFMYKATEKISNHGPYFHSSTTIDIKPGALKRLKKSYERFLYMAAKYPLKDGNGFIPPTYAIDIIWHSHMQEPLHYEADCLRLVGYIIYHDPWPIVEDQNMKKSTDQIDQIWKDEFQCEIEIDHLYNTSDNKNIFLD